MFECKKCITIEQLREFPTNQPPWDTTGGWPGVPHAELFEFIENGLVKQRWKMGEAKCVTDAPNCYQAAVSWEVVPPAGAGQPKLPKHLAWRLGCHTGNQRHRPLKFYFGLCDAKLGFTAVLAAMPTSAIRGEVGLLAMGPVLRLLPGRLVAVVNHAKRLAATPCTIGRATMALHHGARRGYVAWSRLAAADEYLRSNTAGDCWQLLAAHAVAVAKNPPLRQMSEKYGFADILLRKLNKKKKAA